MAALLNLAGLLCLGALLALLYDRALADVLPAAAALLILALFALALFRGLWLIDLLALLCCILCAVLFYRRCGRGALRRFGDIVLVPSALALYAALLVAFFLFRRAIITSTDDLNCWALELKSIWYYGGFAPKYHHAALSFGRYHPGCTLFRWWVCHLAGAYREGLLFIGSGWLYLLLLAPLSRLLDCRRLFAPFLGAAAGGLLLLLPGVTDVMAYISVSAELVMAAAFAGAFLTLLEPADRLGRLRLFAYGALLCLFKASGVFFAFCVLLFALLVPRERAGGLLLDALTRRELFCGAALALLPLAVWYGYCALTARQDYFALQAEAARSGGVLPYLTSLLRALVFVPAHSTRDGGLDLPYLVLIPALSLLWLLAGRLGLLPRHGRALGRFGAGLLVFFMIGLWLVHAFIFREEQYLDPENMILSCSRYGLPLFLGAELLLLRFFAGCRPKGRLLVGAAAAGYILACSCLWTVYYRCVRTERLEAQTALIRESIEEKYADVLSALRQNPGERVLLVYPAESPIDGPEGAWLRYLAAPGSIVFFEYAPGRDAALRALTDEARPDRVDTSRLPSP